MAKQKEQMSVVKKMMIALIGGLSYFCILK